MKQKSDKVYEFQPDVPKTISEKVYYKEVLEKLEELLQSRPDDETVFQDFFEKNPCMVPGCRDEYSSIGRPSGHGPHLDTLITQPNISGIIKRKPDFMWIAYDSDVLIPVIVEIEAPGKKIFTKDHKPTSHFTAARHQLDEWKSILTRPENQLRFYEDFAIIDDLRQLRFKPHYLLLYGRRSEFQGDAMRTHTRGHILGENQNIVSYDRLSPAKNRNFVTCRVKDGRYIAKVLSPLFHIGPSCDDLLSIHDLTSAIESMDFTTNKRKAFLRNRIPYCLDYLASGGTMVKRYPGQNIGFEE